MFALPNGFLRGAAQFKFKNLRFGSRSRPGFRELKPQYWRWIIMLQARSTTRSGLFWNGEEVGHSFARARRHPGAAVASFYSVYNLFSTAWDQGLSTINGTVFDIAQQILPRIPQYWVDDLPLIVSDLKSLRPRPMRLEL